MLRAIEYGFTYIAIACLVAGILSFMGPGTFEGNLVAALIASGIVNSVALWLEIRREEKPE